METIKLFSPYLIIMAAIWAIYLTISRRSEQRAIAIKTAAIEAGLSEPTSLHPIINPATCLGCATCTLACPEGDILGIINGKAELIEPTHCIGHGACKTACPTDAITLVFGTAERGIDLPVVKPDFQSNVPGIFIAGELGGMGLIRNAVEQGRQAVESISKLEGFGQPGRYDLIIVGAGPAGIAAALAAKQKGLSYLVIEQDDLGGTVFKYPRGKVVMTAPAILPIVGKVNFREVSKEQLLEFWKDIEVKQALNVKYRQRVSSIVKSGNGFSVNTGSVQNLCRAVLLAIGRRGTPRELGVPGEDQPKVVYQFIDAEQYRNKHVLIVGGGDSALEAATSIAEQPGTTVTLSYRGDAFGRARSKNRDKASAMARDGKLLLLFKSVVKEITSDEVVLTSDGKEGRMLNDAVIICAGGILPTEFLKSAGIDMVTKYGTA
jgi:thioredoxin reductase (NADPH)